VLSVLAVLSLAAGALLPAAAEGAPDDGQAVIDVTVASVTATGIVPSGTFTIPWSEAAASQFQDVNEMTTVSAIIATAPGSRFEQNYVQQPYTGISLVELARLAGVAPENLSAGPAPAVTVTIPSGNSLMTLSRSEVLDGFADPCEPASACLPGASDTSPNFAVIETGASAGTNSFLALRPMRSFGDYNGDDQVQTSFGGVLDVQFVVAKNVLTVGTPSPLQSTLPGGGGSVTFTAPASVLLGSDPDTDQLSYSWDFGDGQTGSGASATHAYTTPGTFLVFVTVTDGAGNRGVSPPVTVTVAAPARIPPVPTPFPTPPAQQPRPPAPLPKPAIPTPVSAAPVSHASVHTAAPTAAATVRPGSGSPATAKVDLSSEDGGGSGSGSGSGNGTGAGSGNGSGTGAAGGSGTAAQGVALGGSATSGSPTSQQGETSASPPRTKVSGLVGVLVDPSGAIVPVSSAAAAAAARVAAAARALAGGGRSTGVSWLGWLLGGLLAAGVVVARGLLEFEPRAPYRRLRGR